MFGLDEKFKFAECVECGTLRLCDPPGDLSAFYPEQYYSVEIDPEHVLGRQPVRSIATLVANSLLFGHGRLARAAARVIRKRQFHTLVSLIESVALAGLPSGRRSSILDIGCGSGVLAYALSLLGLTEVTGIDPYAPSDRVFDTGARVVRADIDDVTGRYDLVMFHHSLEHVPDPAGALESAREHLTDVGRILVRMPNASSVAFATHGADWVQLDPPRHLNVFSKPGMEALCKRLGLEVIATRDDSTSFQFWGSEQVKRRVPLMHSQSHMVRPAGSPFSRAQIRSWEKSARELNRIGQGDQTVWVLRPIAL